MPVSAPFAERLSRGPGRRLAAWSVGGLIALALVLRWVGLDSQLPAMAPVDERVFVGQLQLFRSDAEHPELDHRFGYYPHLVSRVAAWTLPRSSSYPTVSDEDGGNLEEELARAGALHLHVRRVVALLSLLLVPAVYRLARRWLARGDALVAAAFAALSVLGLWYAQQGRPHAVVAAFGAWALVAFVDVARRGRWRDHALAGLACGLAVAAGQLGVLLVPIWFLAHFLRPRGAWLRELPRLVAPLAFAAVLVWSAYPFVGVEAPDPPPAQALDGSGKVLPGHHWFGEYQVGVFQAGWNGFAPLAAKVFEFEPLLVLLGLLGAGWTLAALVRARRGRGDPTCVPSEPRRAIVVLLAYFVLTAFAAGYFGAGLPRYQVGLLAPLCVFAACVLARARVALGGAARPRRGTATVTVLLALPVLAAEGATAARVAWLRAADDTAELAARALERSAGSIRLRIGIAPALDLPLARDTSSLPASAVPGRLPTHPWIEWQLAHPNASARSFDLEPLPIVTALESGAATPDLTAEVACWDFDLVVLELFRTRLVRAVRAACAARGTLEFRFAPGPSDTPFLANDQAAAAFEEGSLWLRVWRVERFGAVIEIYRFRRE